MKDRKGEGYSLLKAYSEMRDFFVASSGSSKWKPLGPLEKEPAYLLCVVPNKLPNPTFSLSRRAAVLSPGPEAEHEVKYA